MKKTIVGIDPGSSGSIAHFKNGVAVAVKMPKGTHALNEYFKYLRENNEDIIVFLECVSHFVSDDADRGKKFAIQKMMNNYQELKTLLVTNNLCYCEAYAQSWQSKLLNRIKGESKPDRKKRYKDFAQELYPEVKVTLANSDALCIMRFGIIKLQEDASWVIQRLNGNPDSNLFN